jgi:uncharacterized protein with PIN domain
VAAIANEQDGDVYRTAIKNAPVRLMSAVSLLEDANRSVLTAWLKCDVGPFDPAVVVLTAITVFALALAASALPARRAASVDPIQALRGE